MISDHITLWSAGVMSRRLKSSVVFILVFAMCQILFGNYCSQKNLSAKMLIAIARTSRGMFFVTNIRFL